MSVRTVSRYYDDAAYIQAMKQHIEAYWAQNGRSEKLMLSFHGIPQKHHDDGDPYPDECHHTVKLLAQALGLSEQEYIVSFQSQFGKSQWIKPSTQALFDQLPKQGTTKLDVFCPGFLADCLEPWKKSPLWDANNSTPQAAKNTVTSPVSTIPRLDCRTCTIKSGQSARLDLT